MSAKNINDYSSFQQKTEEVENLREEKYCIFLNEIKIRVVVVVVEPRTFTNDVK